MKKLIWLIILGAIVVLGWDKGKVFLHEMSQPRADVSKFSSEQLARIDEINASLPRKLDGKTMFVKAQARGDEIVFQYKIDYVVENLYQYEKVRVLDDKTTGLKRLFCRAQKKYEIVGTNPSLVIFGKDDHLLGKIKTRTSDCKRRRAAISSMYPAG